MVGGNPFKSDLPLKQKLIDDVKFAVDVAVFFPSGAIAADGDRRLIVGKDQRGLQNYKKLREKGR
jgi:hypothetical protein